jgi:hypothetical protein
VLGKVIVGDELARVISIALIAGADSEIKHETVPPGETWFGAQLTAVTAFAIESSSVNVCDVLLVSAVMIAD